MSNLKMLLVLSRILSRSGFILILMMFHLVASVPVKPRKRSPNESEQGFSASPRILEIQLPLKITSKEDLIAWSKYVMRLVASKINRTTSAEKRGSLVDNSSSKTKETMKKTLLNEKRPGVNYPARRLKEPPRPDDMVVAYPLPIGGTKPAMSKQDSFGLPTSNTNGLAQFANFGNPFQQSEIDFFGNPELLAQPPASAYLPLPMRTNDIGAYENTVNKSTSGLQEPVKLQTMKKKSFNLHIKALNNDLEQLPIIVNNGLTGKNVSRESLLTFPFQALITITRQQLPAATAIAKTQQKDHLATRARNPLDEFPPYFEKNYTFTNEAGQINVVLNNDFAANTSREKVEPKEEEERNEKEEEEEEQNVRTQKKKSEKKTKNEKIQKSRKRQSSVLGDLLRMLGILRKVPKNSTEVNVAPPVFSILKGTNTQKIQVAFEEEPPPNRGRRNETSQAQEELNDDDEEEEEEEEEQGGSIQAIIDLLPLAAPILEELSDPEADVNLAEVLQGAIPLLEGLSDPNEEGGIDIPAVLLPLSQRLSEGPDGQGSDSGAILGPLIQLIAPLIGPLVGPLIGPLSRLSSGPGGKEGSASVVASIAGPLSEPQGPYGQSILSSLIASISAKLSTELAKSAGDSDVKALVSSLVQGVLAGASAGSSGPKGYGPNSYGPNGPKGNRDTYYAPTTYGGFDSYGSYRPSAPNPADMISAAIKEIFGAVLKLSATSSTSSVGLSGTSSTSSANLSTSSIDSSKEQEKPVYSAPTNPPYPPSRPSYSPPSTSSPYATFVRRQGRQKKKS